MRSLYLRAIDLSTIHMVVARNAPKRPEIEEIVVPLLEEANEVLFRLRTLVCRKGYATVAELYELVGISGRFLDQRSGWVSLRGAHVARVHDGFILKLPKTTCLEGV
jgi:hypothetical protein